MTTVSSPPSADAKPPGGRPPSDLQVSARAVVVLLAVGLAVAVLAAVATSLPLAAAVMALIVVAAAAWAFVRNIAMLPWALGLSLWLEGVAVGPISVGRVMAAAVVVLTIIFITMSDWRPPALRPIGWMPAVVFLSYAIASGLWSSQFGGWLTGFLRLFVSVAYGIGFMWYVDSSRQLRNIIAGWYWLGIPLAFLNGGAYLISDLRTAGASGGVNAYGLYLGAAVIVGVVLGQEASRKMRWAYWGSIPVLIFGLIGTGSRGGFLSVGAIGAFIVLTYPGLNIWQRVRLAAGGAVAMVVGFFVAVTLNDRFLELGSGSSSGRLDIWNVALTQARQAPLFGIGLGQFAANALDFFQITPNADLRGGAGQFIDGGEIDPHSVYIGLFTAYGIWGPLLFGSVVVITFINLRRVRDPQWKLMNWALSGVLVAMLMAGLFGSVEKHKILWVVIGISAAMHPIRPLMPDDPGESAADRRERRRDQRRFGRRTLALDPFVNRVPQRLGSPWPLRRLVGAALVVTILTAFGVNQIRPTRNEATVDLITFKWDSPNPQTGVTFIERRAQTFLAWARSPAFYNELRRRAGVDLDLTEMERAVDARRPDFSAIVRVRIRHTDEETTRRLAEQVLPTMNHLVNQMRDGATIGQVEDLPALSADDEQNFQGILYIGLYGGRPAYTVTGPSLIGNLIVAGILSMLILLSALAIINLPLRIHHDDRPERLLRVRQLGRVPRLRGRGLKRDTEYAMKGLAVSLDARLPGGLGSVAFAGRTDDTNRARLSAAMAAGLASSLELPTVLVDLDIGERRLTRVMGHTRTDGVAEWLNGAALPTTLPVPMGTRRELPRFLRSFVRGNDGVPMWFIPAGHSEVSGDDFAQLGDLVAALSETHAVVVNLPRTPGPVSVAAVLAEIDMVALVLIDGWTEVDDAMMSVDSLRSLATGRLGFLLVDNSLTS